MGRKLLLINDLNRVYVDCSNPEKDKFVLDCLNSIKALPIVSEIVLQDSNNSMETKGDE